MSPAAYHRGNLMFSMDPARLGPREGNRAPPLTGEQEAALIILQTVARKHQVKLDHRPGDLVFLNNYTVLHAREAYEDGDSTSRHLVRLWLHNPTLGLPIPDGFHLIWDCTFGERSKKIINHSYPVIPMPLYIESKASQSLPRQIIYIMLTIVTVSLRKLHNISVLNLELRQV